IAPMPNEVPVTPPMLAGVRTEILRRIDQAREEAKADNQRLDGKIDAAVQRLDSKIDAVRSELKADIHEGKADVHEVKADVHEVKAGLARVEASVARIEVLIEAQEARNKIVLDGLASVLARQDHVEQRVTQVEETVRRLAAGAASPAV